MTRGERIKRVRQEKHMTQQELAEKLYISKSSVSLYENDKLDIKESRLAEIAKVLGVNVGYFFGEERHELVEFDKRNEWLELYDEFPNEEILNVAIAQVRILINIKNLT